MQSFFFVATTFDCIERSTPIASSSAAKKVSIVILCMHLTPFVNRLLQSKYYNWMSICAWVHELNSEIVYNLRETDGGGMNENPIGNRNVYIANAVWIMEKEKKTLLKATK